MSPHSVMRIFSSNSSSLRTAKKGFVLCKHIIRFPQLLQLSKNSKILAFLFLPNANLNPNFQKCIAFGRFQAMTTCPTKSMHRRHV